MKFIYLGSMLGLSALVAFSPAAHAELISESTPLKISAPSSVDLATDVPLEPQASAPINAVIPPPAQPEIPSQPNSAPLAQPALPEKPVSLGDSGVVVPNPPAAAVEEIPIAEAAPMMPALAPLVEPVPAEGIAKEITPVAADLTPAASMALSAPDAGATQPAPEYIEKVEYAPTAEEGYGGVELKNGTKIMEVSRDTASVPGATPEYTPGNLPESSIESTDP